MTFSGDVFNPSLVSSATRGSHMVPVLNAAEIAVACFGNHDFGEGKLGIVEERESERERERERDR